MRKFKICLAFIFCSLILFGCGQQNQGGGSVATTVANDAELISKLENYKLTVTGITKNERVDNNGTKETSLDIEFMGYSYDIEIKEEEGDIVRFLAYIKDDFFITEKKQELVYEKSTNSLQIVALEELIIKPLVPFDIEMFYDETRKLNLRYKNETGVVEILITKENIENIEFSEYKGEGIHKGDFSYIVYMLIKCKNGEEYLCYTLIDYMPYAKRLGDYTNDSTQPIWNIEFKNTRKQE